MKALLSSMFQPAESKIPAISPHQSHPVCHMLCITSWMLWATAGRKDACAVITKDFCSFCASCRDYSLSAAAQVTELAPNVKVKCRYLVLHSLLHPLTSSQAVWMWDLLQSKSRAYMSLLDSHPVDSKGVRGRTTLCTRVSRFSVS